MLIPDGDTVTIGGLSNERKIERVSKVPVWGHIPLLGGLFSSRQHTRSLNEITIYLTPTIIEQ
jgi:type II secretory pathway component GspD/PulD (secretin)